MWACWFADRKHWSETRALWGKEGTNPGGGGGPYLQVRKWLTRPEGKGRKQKQQ